MGMSTEELGILFGGISSILAVLIYFTKNIKQSSCCGSECKQVVIDGHGDVVKSPEKSVDYIAKALETYPQQKTAII